MAQDVRELRGKLALSREEFATLCGVAVNTVYKWETDVRQPHPACVIIMDQLADPKFRDWHLHRLKKLQTN